MKILSRSNSPSKALIYCVLDNGDTIRFESETRFTAKMFKQSLSDEIAEHCGYYTESLTKVIVIGYGFIVEFTPEEALNEKLMYESLRKHIDEIMFGMYEAK